MVDVTILMATHNDEPFIEAAVRSILDQSFCDFDFLIIDDASTDATPSILTSLAEEDPRIKILRLSQNVGLAAALNKGLRSTTSPLIARMDGDDISDPNRLQVQLNYLRQHPEVDVVGSYARDMDELGVLTGRLRKVPVSTTDTKRLVWCDPVIHPSAVFHREKILSLGGYDPRLRRRQDYDLWFRAIKAGLIIANIPQPLIDYRVRSGAGRISLSRSWDQVKIGWRGCWSLGTGPLAYFGVLFPLVLSLVPSRFRQELRTLLNFLDPRQR
ncbi:glycosyltransferase involved in cell wall biosynthesis [Rhizobium laguerreae]|uniref:Glycosyltransferase involved in cell wall biosynthesis n=1 Tax=Rhizobium laguerreae TaxID=1076926 RepID=A0ABR6G482_9HYPH|nr:glycosyltransferase [Rhizobium laguerreae]MBB3161070.1 glycosyltransferase involved in cell wall biosynthesis [Rhizobium laguerreae]OOO51957.1 hypothetical protein BS630_06160 [Rhizobium laguerreae]